MTKHTLEGEFLELLNRCQGTILRLCMLYTDRQPDSINDLYQEIVCALWESFPQFRNLSKPNTWAYRVALNIANMHCRAQHRRPQFVQLTNYMSDTIPDYEENSMIDRLYRLIDLLNDEDKMLTFLYIDRVPLREIALILNTTEYAVRHKVNRLKHKLRKLNEEYEQ
jgi:RNA polymerase sigma-70 factor (ECF subfamily)